MPRHEGRLESSDPGSVRVCFASARLGGAVLADGVSQVINHSKTRPTRRWRLSSHVRACLSVPFQECVQFCSTPELLVALSFCEALEDNEALAVEGLQQVTKISRAICHPLPEAILVGTHGHIPRFASLEEQL